jgi:hypothetical protein
MDGLRIRAELAIPMPWIHRVRRIAEAAGSASNLLHEGRITPLPEVWVSNRR